MLIENCLTVLLIFIFLVVAIAAHLLGHVLAALTSGVKIEEIRLFSGRPLFTFKIKDSSIGVGYIPTGGYVKLSSEYEQRSLLTRWFLVISGPVAILITSAVALNYKITLIAFLSGFEQIIRGAWAPLTYGKAMIHIFFKTYFSVSIVAAYGVFAAKLAALNLLPLPNLNGGRIITESIPGFNDSKYRFLIEGVVGQIISLALIISWIVALIAYILDT